MRRLKDLDARFQRLPLLVRDFLLAIAVVVVTVILGERSIRDLAMTLAACYIAFVVVDAASLFAISARQTYDDSREQYPWAKNSPRRDR